MSADARSTQGPSRENHYVPEWYQRGFRVAGADNWFLDIAQPRLRPNGTPILARPRPRPPKACFWENDLYITRFGEQLNDQIETVLFQGIDDFGAAAVRAFVGGDVVQVHEQYQAMLAYLGAQKLRTPKGLDWIRSRYPALSQLELMREMQHLRQMFGTLWAEAAHEIVSAENAEVKFLITDHPVTTFNAALPDDAAPLAYPNDAPITWNGTQTLFALDANHLLILTHGPYAKTPEALELTAKRVNARFFGNTMLRTDALIRSRRFDTDAVTAVNALLKSRARRYVAAGQPDWLYPERAPPMARERLAQLLCPPTKDLWRVGGEIHIGYKDGTFGYRDAYGRTSREHESVVKPMPSSPPAANDPCPCGRGDTYGACCEPLPPWERAPWDVMSLQERNQAFLRALAGVLDLTEEDSWQRVQRTLSDEQVAQMHRIARLLWPESTSLAALLPRPGDGRVRAVYMGPSDPRTAGESIISLVPLFDQILVMDPMLASRNLKPEFNPVTTPGAHKQQFLKNAMFWLMLEPLITAGKVLIFPDPGDLAPEFESAMRTMAQERTATSRLNPSELTELSWLGENDVERWMLQLPDDVLLSMFKRATPGKSDAQLQTLLEHMRHQGEEDPLALMQVAGPGKKLGQFLVMRCVNLEVGVFMAQSAGAVIVTDVSGLWRHLHVHTRAGQADESDSATAGDALAVAVALNPYDALKFAETPGAEAARTSLRQLQRATETRSPDAPTVSLLEEWRERLQALPPDGLTLHNPEAQATMRFTASMPPAGFESPTVQRLVVGFGREDAPVFLGLALFRRTEDDEALSGAPT